MTKRRPTPFSRKASPTRWPTQQTRSRPGSTTPSGDSTTAEQPDDEEPEASSRCDTAYRVVESLGVTVPMDADDPDSIFGNVFDFTDNTVDRGFQCIFRIDDATPVIVWVAHYADSAAYTSDTASLSIGADTFDAPGSDAAWYRLGDSDSVAVIRRDQTHYAINVRRLVSAEALTAATIELASTEFDLPAATPADVTPLTINPG